MIPIPALISLAGVAMDVLPDLFSDDKPLPQKALEAVGKAVNSVTGVVDPTVAAKMLQENTEAQARLRELTIKELELHVRDRERASTMQSKLAAIGHGSAWAPAILSLVVVCGFFGAVYTVLNVDLKDGSKELIYMLLGTLAAGFTQVLNFWLGSSRSSQKKTELTAGKL